MSGQDRWPSSASGGNRTRLIGLRLNFIYMRYFLIATISIFVTANALYADSVFMKDGREIKGLIIDEYVDRITLSTVDGEKEIFRKDIERIEYDAPEQNFMQLGRAYDAKGWYGRAAFYYKKAMEINPDYSEARDAYLASHAKMWRQEERMTKKELERQGMVMDWWKNRGRESISPSEDKAVLLKDILGISIIEKDGIFIIDEVRSSSTAARAGIQKGDVLAAIWGRHIHYSKIEDVINELLGPKYSEVRVEVERKISIQVESTSANLYKDIGVLLNFEYRGLVVKDVMDGTRGETAGFKKGDFVIAIDKNMARYLPLDSVIALINSAKNSNNITFTIRRTINLRREGE